MSLQRVQPNYPKTYPSKPAQAKTQSLLIAPAWKLVPISLLVISNLIISNVSLAEIAAPTFTLYLDVETTYVDLTEEIAPEGATADITIEEVTTITPAATSSTPSSIDNNAIRQYLTRIITSEEYASVEEVKYWQLIEDPDDESDADFSWLEEWLRSIFGDSTDSNTFFAVFSLLLKALFIGALIAFIIWVLRRAGYLAGWVGHIKKHTGRRSTANSQAADYQQQGWEQLPAHEQIPTVVKQYLADGKLTEAASVCYRGSLRWLVRTQQLPIAAASTERQCLAQIQQLAQFNDSKPHAYISQIISLWVQVAYDEQQRVQNSAQLSSQLQALTDNWQQQLPPFSNMSSHNNSNNHTHFNNSPDVKPHSKGRANVK